MSDTKILTKEEVDALLNLTHQSEDLRSLSAEPGEKWSEINCGINDRTLTSISMLYTAEAEKLFSAFLRKKISIKSKENRFGSMTDCLKERLDKHTYTVYQLTPNSYFGMVVVDMPTLHYATNLLYGGQIVPEEPVMERPGKVGLLIAEKISEVALEAMQKACGEYGSIASEIVKTVPSPSLSSKINMDDHVCAMEMVVSFGEAQGTIVVVIPDRFLIEFIPVKSADEGQHVESNFWRAAVETQVADSLVEINVTLPDASVKLKDFMGLEVGDLIPIADPTLAYICLNNLKLFKATAGQANSKRVVKVVGEI